MDLTFCGLGYFFGAVFLSLEMIWLSGVWIAASEANFYKNIQITLCLGLSSNVRGVGLCSWTKLSNAY